MTKAMFQKKETDVVAMAGNISVHFSVCEKQDVVYPLMPEMSPATAK